VLFRSLGFEYTINDSERNKLLLFANFMSVSLKFYTNPRNKRAHLTDLATRLAEGNQVSYLKTGKGMSKNIRRRINIYETLSDVKPIKCPNRRSKKRGDSVTENSEDELEMEAFAPKKAQKISDEGSIRIPDPPDTIKQDERDRLSFLIGACDLICM